MKRLAVMLVFLLLGGLCPCARGETPCALTILVYMTGSDLESRDGAAAADLGEMLSSLPAGDDIRLLVLTGGAKKWTVDIDPGTHTVYEIKNGAMFPLYSCEARSMGDPDTLADFLCRGQALAPAASFGLILWDHGAGPLMGVCFDEQFTDDSGGMDALFPEELGEALAGSPFRDRKLSFIGFDACLMCTAEMAAAAAPYAEYMVASQETEPAGGWDYAFLGGILPGDGGDDIGRRIVEAYASSLGDSTAPVTMACLDLSLADILLEEIDRFFGALDAGITRETYPVYTRCRADAKVLGTRTTSDFDLVDLYDLADVCSLEGLGDSTALKGAISAMVTSSCAMNVDCVHGLSIYYPFDNKSRYVSPWGARYENSGFSGAYRCFIGHISEYYLGGAFFEPDGYLPDTEEGREGTRISLSLSEEEAAAVVRARMIVLSEKQKDVYQLIWYDDRRVRRDDREISCAYGGEALFVTDREGNVIAGPVSFFPAGDGVAVMGILYGEAPDGTPRANAARLVYRWDEDGCAVLSEVLMPQNGTGDIFLPARADTDAFTSLELLSFGPVNVESGDPVTSTDFEMYFAGISLSLSDDSWQFSVMPLWDRCGRYAYLRLTDVRGETVCSEAVSLPNPSVLPAAELYEIVPAKPVSLRLCGADMVTGFDAGLRFLFEARNLTEGPLILGSAEVLLDGVSLGEGETMRIVLGPGEEDMISVFFSAERLAAADLPPTVERGTAVLTFTDAEGGSVTCRGDFPLALRSDLLR